MRPVSIGPHGIVHGFADHDGSLDGVMLSDEGRTVSFALRSSAGVPHTLWLRGVRYLDIDNMRAGNIVVHMHAEMLDASGRLPEPLARFADELRSVSPGELAFWVDCAYGAEIVAVCTSIEVEP